MTKKPVHTIKFGFIKLDIWRNETSYGSVRHSVAPIRLFKDGDRWRESTRFGKDDLLLLAKAADLAHTWVCTESQDHGTCLLYTSDAADE